MDERESYGWATACGVSLVALAVLLALVGGCGGHGSHGTARGVLLCGRDESYLPGPSGGRIWLTKVYGPDWRDPSRDVPPDGSPCPWAALVLSDVPPSSLVGHLGAAPSHAIHPFWCAAPGAQATAPVWVRRYTDSAGTDWQIVRYAATWPEPYRVRVHAREAWRHADIELEW
jgi:hypothetical protein